MALERCDSKDLSIIIKNLKNGAPGWDEISAQIIKSNEDFFLDPLVHLINLSLKCGVFPDILKLANVIQLFKAGLANKVNNYRPVSLLCVFSKVFEKVYFKR